MKFVIEKEDEESFLLELYFMGKKISVLKWPISFFYYVSTEYKAIRKKFGSLALAVVDKKLRTYTAYARCYSIKFFP